MEGLGALMIIVWLLVAAVAIAWILLPFALFGTKQLLRDIRRELEEANRLQREARAAAGGATPIGQIRAR